MNGQNVPTAKLAAIQIVRSRPGALHANVGQVEWLEVELAGGYQSGTLAMMCAGFVHIVMRGRRHAGGKWQGHKTKEL